MNTIKIGDLVQFISSKRGNKSGLGSPAKGRVIAMSGGVATIKRCCRKSLIYDVPCTSTYPRKIEE